jgi:glutathionyl-hydroquinone reductase
MRIVEDKGQVIVVFQRDQLAELYAMARRLAGLEAKDIMKADYRSVQNVVDNVHYIHDLLRNGVYSMVGAEKEELYKEGEELLLELDESIAESLAEDKAFMDSCAKRVTVQTVASDASKKSTP